MLDNLSTTLGDRTLEQVIIGGDLSRLSPAERVSYYTSLCESVGLNPLTKPLDYITLNGKMTLYAKRDCTDQLRKINGVSIVIVSREMDGECYIVIARATDRTGRCDESSGSVPIGNLKGEARSNAIMKAETKAKRRVTLSICGLGWLDETEISSIVSSHPIQAPKVNQVPEPIPESQHNKEQDMIYDIVAEVKRFLSEEKPEDAYSLCESLTDSSHKSEVWQHLSSMERSMLKSVKESPHA